MLYMCKKRCWANSVLCHDWEKRKFVLLSPSRFTLFFLSLFLLLLHPAKIKHGRRGKKRIESFFLSSFSCLQQKTKREKGDEPHHSSQDKRRENLRIFQFSFFWVGGGGKKNLDGGRSHPSQSTFNSWRLSRCPSRRPSHSIFRVS